jgi:hypothetical protein
MRKEVSETGFITFRPSARPRAAAGFVSEAAAPFGSMAEALLDQVRQIVREEFAVQQPAPLRRVTQRVDSEGRLSRPDPSRPRRPSHSEFRAASSSELGCLDPEAGGS